MAAKVKAKPLGKVFGERLREQRKRRGWTQERLAQEVRDLGGSMDRVTITKIETGGTRARNIALEDAVLLAAALDTPPTLLMLPLGTEGSVEVTPTIAIHPHAVLKWMEGESPLMYSNRAPRHIAAWEEAVQPLWLYRELREHQQAMRAADAALRRAEYVGDERDQQEARRQRAEGLTKLGQHLERMEQAGIQPPGLPVTWIDDMEELGIETRPGWRFDEAEQEARK